MSSKVRQKQPISQHASSSHASAAITDPRFADIETDPRFRLPGRKHTRVQVDKRFARVLNDDDFAKKARVDRYGRKIEKKAGRRELERLYRLEDADEDENDNKDGEEKEEDESDEADDDEDVLKELKRVEGYDPAREGGFSESSSSEEESTDEEVDIADDEEDAVPEETSVPMGDATSRIAAVNLDWDNIRAVDIMAVAGSFVPKDGRIEKVTVYPSEFGKQRMKREEAEGPPREIFGAVKEHTDDNMDTGAKAETQKDIAKPEIGTIEEDKGEEFNSTALRAYQLDRLRYYYAIITCDSVGTARALYDSMDGREYLSTANSFDLRFVPDEVTFDDKPRDECIKLPSSYKPNDFVTEALTHSKVKLTWDADDRTRKELQKRAFSRAEMDENDLQAYIGSEESSSEDDETAKKSKASALRAALGLTDAPVKSLKNSGPVGDMEITFTPAFSASKASKDAKQPVGQETTMQAYMRKEKERKAKRREKRQAQVVGSESEEEEALTSGSDADSELQQDDSAEKQDLGFDDPFFTNPEADKKARKKAEKVKARREEEQNAEENRSKRAELALLTMPDSTEAAHANMDHFDMNAIAKHEKRQKRKGKGKRSGKAISQDANEEIGLQTEFKMDVQDPRFQRVFEDHEYALDPTNPKYKGTVGTKALLEESRRRRKGKRDMEDSLDSDVRRGKKNRVR
jgi:hypothetical protein